MPDHPVRPAAPSRPTRRAWLASLASLCLLPAGAHALPPNEPIPGITLQANQAFVGDPLLGMEPGQPGNLYGFFEDASVHMASTTKSFALLLAVEAVESGYVALDDLVVISEKAAGINDNHAGSGQNTHSNQGFGAGMVIAFEDLLYSMMHTSAGDASIAIAQHVAVALDPTLADESDAVQEAAFTDRMNARAAELGLEDTVFYNAYGGDHVHGNDNTAGPDTDHGASTRDMATWFAVGMELPLYREIAGFQGTWSFGSWNTPDVFSAVGGGSYPGLTGGKGGSGGGCGTCGIASARRVGRELVEAYTQGQAGDGSTLLDYGFASLFHPALQAESDAWTGGWQSEDLACMTPTRAASVVVDGSGESEVLVWGLDLAGGTIEHRNPVVPAFEPVGGLVNEGRQGPDDGAQLLVASTSYTTGLAEPEPVFATLVAPKEPEDEDVKVFASRSGGDGRSGPDFPTEEGTPTLTPVVIDARIHEAGTGRLAVVEESDQGVRLFLYGVTPQDDPFLMDWDFVGQGTQPRVTHVEAPSGHFVVTVHRRPDGQSELNAFRLVPDYASPGIFQLSNPTDTRVFSEVASLEIARVEGAARFVVASRGLSGGREVRAYGIDSVTGEIDVLDGWSFAGASSRVRVTRVPGFGTASVFALGFVNGNGEPSLEVFRLASDGVISSLGKAASDETVAAGESLRIAPYREDGVLLAYTDGLSRRLEVWALDADEAVTDVDPEMLTREDWGGQGLHGMCRVPGDAAEGDFLLSKGTAGATGLQVEAWRSAAR